MAREWLANAAMGVGLLVVSISLATVLLVQWSIDALPQVLAQEIREKYPQLWDEYQAQVEPPGNNLLESVRLVRGLANAVAEKKDTKIRWTPLGKPSPTTRRRRKRPPPPMKL